MCDFDDFDDFGDEIEIEDFALIGGVIGYFEEQLEEERVLDRINEGLETDDDGAP